MRINRFATLTLALVATCALAARGADPGEVQDQFDATFRLLEQADAARSAGRADDARRLYGATIAAYQELAATYPNVQPELVRFRVAYCRNQVMGLLTSPAEGGSARAPLPSAAALQRPPPSSGLPIAPAVAQGIALCRTGLFEKARHVVRDYCADNPDDAMGLLVQATACLGLGDNATARALLEQAVAKAPALREAHYNLAQLLVRAGTPDFEAARRHYQASVRLGGARDEDLEAVLALD
jgi:hypothetical protein